VSSRLDLHTRGKYRIEALTPRFLRRSLLEDIRSYAFSTSALANNGSFSFLEGALSRHPPLDDREYHRVFIVFRPLYGC
jgi:hypothetical protein